jgi:Fe-S cluster biogenesis protein NfuA
MIDRGDAQDMLDSLFGADGYSVAVHTWPDEHDGRLAFEVVAGEGACADCLVPKSTLRAIVAKRLELADPALVDVTYPPDSPTHLG